MKVDIIMPIYNPDKNVIKAINSCLLQSHKESRLTIIDDCSTEDISFIRRLNPGIIILKTPENMGPAGARNWGMKHSAGSDLISFLDADDIMHKDKLAISVKAFKDNLDIGMTCGNYRILVNERLRGPFYKRDFDIDHRRLMRQNFVASGSVTIKREVYEDLGGFNEDYWIAEDYDYWLRISEKYPIKYIHKILYFYRIIPGGGSLTQRADIQEKHIENLKKIKDASRGRLIDAARKSKENTDKDLSS